jgi:hypothetical protein
MDDRDEDVERTPKSDTFSNLHCYFSSLDGL